MFTVPAHKQTDPAQAAGQIINRPAAQVVARVTSPAYKPTHGGRPDTEDGLSAEEREALKIISHARSYNADDASIIAALRRRGLSINMERAQRAYEELTK